jgi:hypothetical protein
MTSHKGKKKEIREKEIETERRQENTGQWKNMEEKEEHMQNRRQKCFRLLPLITITTFILDSRKGDTA